MRIRRTTLLVLLAPLVLLILAAYLHWAMLDRPQISISQEALRQMIRRVRPKPEAQAVASLPLETALHGQTLLAYEMNFGPLPELHGAPLRLRVENQLGFKMVKWIRAIEFVANVQCVGKGEGGYNEDHEYFGELANI